MREAKLLATTEIDVDAFRVQDRLRPVPDMSVTSLIASIKEIGLQQEIHVRKSRHRDGHLHLISGGHRTEAYRRMSWQKIPSNIWDCSNDWAALAEIYDNLAHTDLEPLDMAVLMATHKGVYERMFPEAKAVAFKGNRHTGSQANDIMSFTRSVAQNRNMSARHIERLVAARQALDKPAIALLRQSRSRVTLADLQVIAKATPDERPIICREMSQGKVKSAKEVLDRCKHPGAKAGTPADLELRKLDDAWACAFNAARRRFVDAHAAELRDLSDVEQ